MTKKQMTLMMIENHNLTKGELEMILAATLSSDQLNIGEASQFVEDAKNHIRGKIQKEPQCNT
jgi:hypothetical protein